MVLVHVVIHIFHEGLKMVIIGGLQLLPDGALLLLNVNIKVFTVAKHITENVHGLRYIIFEGQHVVQGELTGGVGIELMSPILNFSLKLDP